MNTIKEIRNHYVQFGGFTGGWNVLLEGFSESQAVGGPKIAVSEPMQSGSWLTKQFGSMAREVELGAGLCVVVIDDWEQLERRVNQDALKERLLVMITGNLVGDSWDRAIRFSGRTDGYIRRSIAKVPVGAPYWYPTEDQLAAA